MKICIIGKFPPIQGGVSMRTYWTTHSLAERGHEVHVVTNAREVQPPFRMHMRPQDWARCEPSFATGGSVTVHWTDPVDRSQSYIPFASPFVSKLATLAAKAHAERRFDVIYSHYMEPYGVAGYLAAQIAGVPHVVRMAGSDAGRLWRHPQFDALYDHVLRCADIVIAAGAVARRAIERGVDPHRVASGGGYRLPESLFTPEGPQLDYSALLREVQSDSELADACWGDFDGGGRYFGIYGKLAENKGSFALLAAMHRLKRAGVKVGLVALAHGRPDVEREFRRQAEELQLVDRILQIPFVPHWRVPEFLRGCLAVCCLEQDFPIAIHTPITPREVLLCGRCLVASTELIGKLPDYEQLPSGYGCVAVENVNDVDALAEQLAAIADDPEPAAAVGARGRDFVRALEHRVSFPDRLEQLLTGAARGERIAAFEVEDGAGNGDADDPFLLTRLAAAALREKGGDGSTAFRQEGSMGLPGARRVLAAVRHAVAGGGAELAPLVPAIEIEIAVAAAEASADRSRGDRDFDVFHRLRVGRWAIGNGDIGALIAIRHPRLRIVAFDFDVAPYLGARQIGDLPATPVSQPSYIVAFARADDGRREPLLVDPATARILQLSDAKRTSRAIAEQLLSERGFSSIAQCLAWIEDLFRRGLIGLREANHAAVGARQQAISGR